MAPSNLPPIFNATSQDIEMLLAAQCHLGSKNLQVHMEPYLWKTRPDGINVLNIGKTWYVVLSVSQKHCVSCYGFRRLPLLDVTLPEAYLSSKFQIALKLK